jgi:hypothetical protein
MTGPEPAAHPGLVFTVSTVKDSARNVLDFVARNQAAGADHMVVFVDDADPEVREALEATPGATPVPTGDEHWQGRRPRDLNARQVHNATLVNVALSVLPEARWLFHLDGDECLHLDRERLLALPDDVAVVKLRTLEAVSRLRWDGPVTHFKRQLGDDELALLAELGVLARPTMRHYFRGHTRKPGMRPHPDHLLRIHHVERGGEPVEPFEADWLQVLHYESCSGEEFVRKWMALISGGPARQRVRRDRLRSAISAVTANAVLTPAAKEELLTELFRRHALDDFALLDELGYLEQPGPERHRHRPLPLHADQQAVLDELLPTLCRAQAAYVGRGRAGRRPADLLRDARDRLDPAGTLRRSVSRAIDDVAASPAGATP